MFGIWVKIVQDFEDGQLISIDGSFEAGVDHDKAGYLMLGDPQEGDVYRQEFSLGNAEDAGEVLGYVDGIEANGVTYDDVLKTRDFTPLDPESREFKYYAPGIGVIVEENLVDGDRSELIEAIFP